MSLSNNFAVETKDLSKVYKEGNIRAVNKLNIGIKKGEIYALIGANGSGKTTLINMMTGALPPTSGTINILGLDLIKNRHQVSNLIGVVPQDYSLYSDLTVRENISFFAKIYRVGKQDFENRFSDLINILKLQKRSETVVGNLSGGLKRRVSIACSLIHKPRIVFFDEATVGIDPVMRSFFWQYFHALSSSGLTLVITSHVMDEAGRADRIGLLRDGQIIEEGEPENLMNKHNVNSIEDVFLKLSSKEFNDD